MTERERLAHARQIVKARRMLSVIRSLGAKDDLIFAAVSRGLAKKLRNDGLYSKKTNLSEIEWSLAGFWKHRHYWESDECERSRGDRRRI